MSNKITFGLGSWEGEKRVDLTVNRPNLREPTVYIRIGFESVTMSRHDFATAFRTLEIASAAGGSDPEAWRRIIVPIEKDLVQEMQRAVHCDVIDMPSGRYPNGRALVIGFEDPDFAEAARAALQVLINAHPPLETKG